MTGHALEFERGRTVANLLHLWPAQVVAQLGIADQQHRQDHACASSQPHKPLEPGERLVVQPVGFIDDQHDGMLVLAHKVAEFALAPSGLLWDSDLAAIARRQVVDVADCNHRRFGSQPSAGCARNHRNGFEAAGPRSLHVGA